MLDVNDIKISIIVPIYNGANFICETVNNILNQTYSNFQLILINDGSIDNTWKILLNLKEKDSRIEIYNQKNLGVSATRKFGYSISNGDYITFVDADDKLLIDSIEILVNKLKIDNYDIVNGSFISSPNFRLWKHKKLGSLNKLEYLESIIFGYTYTAICASIYRKSIFAESSFNFDRTLKIGEDILMNIELVARVNKVLNIEDIVYIYNNANEDSAMTKIIRHPLYFVRYFNIKNKLIETVSPEIFRNNKLTIINADSLTIIKSFYSSYIDFDERLFYQMQDINTNIWENNIYVFCLKNKCLAMFLKFGIKLFKLTKSMFFEKSKIKKEIIF